MVLARLIALCLWTVALGVASLLPPGSSMTSVFPHGDLDWLAHAVGYGVLAFLTLLAVRPLGEDWGPALALGFPFVLGVGMEFAQELVGRTFELSDLFANGAGIGIGLTVGLFACSLTES